MIATIVDWSALGALVPYSFAGALLLTCLFTTGVLLREGEGTSTSPMRRAGGALCLALCLALVAFGIYVMFTTK